MNIYVVSYSSGQYEDHGETIDAVFDNKEAAEKHVEFITAHFHKLRDTEEPYPNEDYMESTLTEEQDNEYAIWQQNRYIGNDFNSAYIEEHELNSVLKSVISELNKEK